MLQISLSYFGLLWLSNFVFPNTQAGGKVPNHPGRQHPRRLDRSATVQQALQGRGDRRVISLNKDEQPLGVSSKAKMMQNGRLPPSLKKYWNFAHFQAQNLLPPLIRSLLRREHPLQPPLQAQSATGWGMLLQLLQPLVGQSVQGQMRQGRILSARACHLGSGPGGFRFHNRIVA